MTRDLFLIKLYRKLKWQTTRKAAQGIIAEYCERFNEESALGKSEQEICENLGTPAQAANNAIRAQSNHNPMQYKISFLAGIILLLFFPIMSLHGATYRALWQFQVGFRYIYVLLAPLICLVFLRLQHTWEISFTQTPTATRFFRATAALALMICAVCSFAVYNMLLHYATVQSYSGPLLYHFLRISIWLIAAVWIASALFCDACGCYFPYIYFLYAFCMVTISTYAEALSSMNPPPFETLLASTFQEIPIFFLLTIVGALFWFLFTRYKKRMEGKFAFSQ